MPDYKEMYEASRRETKKWQKYAAELGDRVREVSGKVEELKSRITKIKRGFYNLQRYDGMPGGTLMDEGYAEDENGMFVKYDEVEKLIDDQA